MEEEALNHSRMRVEAGVRTRCEQGRAKWMEQRNTGDATGGPHNERSGSKLPYTQTLISYEVLFGEKTQQNENLKNKKAILTKRKLYTNGS